MKEVNRIALVGERVKITNEIKNEWDKVLIPKNSIATVKRVFIENSFPKGFVLFEEFDTGVFPEDYIVIEQ